MVLYLLDNQQATSKHQHNEEDLLRFLKKKQPIIERALSQNEKNIYFDYSALKASEKYIFIYFSKYISYINNNLMQFKCVQRLERQNN